MNLWVTLTREFKVIQRNLLVPVMNQINHPQIYHFYEQVKFSLIMILLIQANLTNSRITLNLQIYVYCAYRMKHENDSNYFFYTHAFCVISCCYVCRLVIHRLTILWQWKNTAGHQLIRSVKDIHVIWTYYVLLHRQNPSLSISCETCFTCHSREFFHMNFT